MIAKSTLTLIIKGRTGTEEERWERREQEHKYCQDEKGGLTTKPTVIKTTLCQ